MSNEEVQDRHAGDGFFGVAKGYFGGLKTGLLRFCNDRGSQFISAHVDWPSTAPTVLVNGVTEELGTSPTVNS